MIIFPTSSGKLRRKTSYSITKNYWKSMMAEQEEEPFTLQLKAIDRSYNLIGEEIGGWIQSHLNLKTSILDSTKFFCWEWQRVML